MDKINLLNLIFDVDQYSSTAFNDEEDKQGIYQALETDLNSHHCSNYGSQHYLVLECQSIFKLSHLAFRKSNSANSQLKSGILIVTDEKITEDEIDKYNLQNQKSIASKYNRNNIICFETDSKTYNLEIEIMNNNFNDQFMGKQLSIKFLECYNDNNQLNLGTIAIMGTLDLKVKSERIGPIAHKFGIFKAPRQLINNLEVDDADLINKSKSIIFFSKVPQNDINKVAEHFKGSYHAFKANIDEPIDSNLSLQLFKEKIDDVFVVCIKGVGYRQNGKLMEQDYKNLIKFVDLVEKYGENLKELERLDFDVKNLECILKRKTELSEFQNNHVNLRNDLNEFKNNLLNQSEVIKSKIDDLRKLQFELIKTIDVIERIFGIDENFICINKQNESKSIKTLLFGKTHLLLQFSAKWCKPCHTFTPKLISSYEKSTNKSIVIIFISSDEDEKSFKEQINEMPWYAVKQSDQDFREVLSHLHEVKGIPKLVCMKTDGTVLFNNFRFKIEQEAELAFNELK